jgi:hypothetical protein
MLISSTCSTLRGVDLFGDTLTKRIKRQAGDSAAAAYLFNFQYSMLLTSGARLRQIDSMGYYQIQDPLRTHSTIKMTL